MRNCVLKHQSAKRMAELDAMVKLLTWCSSSQCEFVDGRQAGVLRRNFSTGVFATPKCECPAVMSAPRDVDADHIKLSPSDLRKTRDGINEVLEAADIG